MIDFVICRYKGGSQVLGIVRDIPDDILLMDLAWRFVNVSCKEFIVSPKLYIEGNILVIDMTEAPL